MSTVRVVITDSIYFGEEIFRVYVDGKLVGDSACDWEEEIIGKVARALGADFELITGEDHDDSSTSRSTEQDRGAGEQRKGRHLRLVSE